MNKVCHISTAHILYDPRVLYRECSSLVNAGFDVSLVIQADSNQTINGVKIVSLKKTSNRFFRIFFLTWVAFFKALKTKSKIYHFHDPELVFHGLLLKLLGKKVVFDVHENIHLQIKDKEWLPLNKVIANLYLVFDYVASKSFTLILAEKSYVNHYKKFTSNYIIVYNYPDVNFFNEYINEQRSSLTQNQIFYSGGVFHNRGIDVIIKALNILHQKNIPFYFHCIGKYTNEYLEEISNMPEYAAIKDYIKFYGYLPIDQGYTIAKNCKVGLAILRPIGNYLQSYSTKNFEYMAIGLPTITCNFKLYTDIYDNYKCGICVNPIDENEIANAIEVIFDNKDGIAQEFSKIGIETANKYFNWTSEAEKINQLYLNLLK